MVEKKKILILGFSDIKKDPRIKKQITFLKDEYDLTVIGHGTFEEDGVEFHSIPIYKKNRSEKAVAALRLLSGMFERHYWQQPQVNQMSAIGSLLPFDAILANDIDTLPLACKLAGYKPVIFDAHEYFPCEFEDLLMWRIFYKRYKKHLCARYLTDIPHMMTVSNGLAKAYRTNYKVDPKVVTNACHYHDLSPHPCPETGIRIICHGGVHPSRRVENIVALAQYLDDRFILELILVPMAGFESYYHKIVAQAKKFPNIVLSPPVAMSEIVPRVSQADIGLYILPASSFNHAYALPNRFGDFIQARLAIAVGPSAEMGDLVKKHGCGVVADSFSAQSMAKALNALTPAEIDAFKQASHRYALSYNAEKNGQIVQELVRASFC